MSIFITVFILKTTQIFIQFINTLAYICWFFSNQIRAPRPNSKDKNKNFKSGTSNISNCEKLRKRVEDMNKNVFSSSYHRNRSRACKSSLRFTNSIENTK